MNKKEFLETLKENFDEDRFEDWRNDYIAFKVCQELHKQGRHNEAYSIEAIIEKYCDINDFYTDEIDGEGATDWLLTNCPKDKDFEVVSAPFDFRIKGISIFDDNFEHILNEELANDK